MKILAFGGLIIATLLFCTPNGSAQNIYGSSSISFNAAGTTGVGDCETDLDGDADTGYYAARVTCVAKDPNGKTVATGAYSDDGDRDGYAAVSLTFTTTPGLTYTVTGGHSAALTVPYDAPEGQPNEYFDELNFEAYVETPDRGLANLYQWFGPGPEVETHQQAISLPQTVAKGTAPSVSSCQTPTGEISTFVRQTVVPPYYPTTSDFLQTLSSPVPDNGATITEAENAPGTDSCYFPGSFYNPSVTVSGGTWLVGQNTPGDPEAQVTTPSSGQWGPDVVGWQPEQVRYYQQNRPKHGLSVTCSFQLTQNLTITCPNKSSIVFDGYIPISSTIDATGITNCREGTCSGHNPYQ